MNVQPYESELALTKEVYKMLETRGYIVLKPPDDPNSLKVDVVKDNKLMNLYLFIYMDKINIQLYLPFKSEQYMTPVISVYMDIYNNGKAFSKLHHNPESGALYYDYTYMVLPGMVNQEHFKVYLDALTDEAGKNYTELSHLAIGLLSEGKKEQLILLLNEQIRKLRQMPSEENVAYGDNVSGIFNK